MTESVQIGTITTNVPARLDRLPWSRFHWRMVIGLGGVWVLDGLEVTMVGNVSARLTDKGSSIALNAASVGWAAAFYVAGACLGALFFGQLTDRFGRRKLFTVTLSVYLTFTIATAFAFAPWFFFITRFFTGSRCGWRVRRHHLRGRRVPARARAWAGGSVLGGCYWLGSAAGAAGALSSWTSRFSDRPGWRVSFGIGAAFGFFLLGAPQPSGKSPLVVHPRA